MMYQQIIYLKSDLVELATKESVTCAHLNFISFVANTCIQTKHGI